MGKIQVGTASWTDPTLIKSRRFYPKGVTSAEERLRFYATRFELVEVNSSYYALPTPANSLLWTERTPDSFTFNIKAFRLFTGHQTPLEAFPPGLREALPDVGRKRNVYYKDVPAEIRDELWALFIDAIKPLDEAGKLGAVHFQFPPWVFYSRAGFEHLEECRARLPQNLCRSSSGARPGSPTIITTRHWDSSARTNWSTLSLTNRKALRTRFRRSGSPPIHTWPS